ncbi:MAG: transposase [Chitinispirillales bacterium]|nr:transposase [Chitinispirillales bacterium]
MGTRRWRLAEYADHIHVLFGLRPAQSISEIMQHIKGSSSEWINRQKLTKGKFKWQSGYGAFSYAKSQIPVVTRYKVYRKPGKTPQKKNVY